MGIWQFLLLLWVFIQSSTSGIKLSDYVHHYETLDYDSSLVHREHYRHKRSLPEDDHSVSVKFRAHDKNFHLKLVRDNSVFHNDLVIEDVDGTTLSHLDTSHIYHGVLQDEPNSFCFGAIRDGVFDGQIQTSKGTYFVERVQKYHKDLPSLRNNQTVHSVIYHEKHMTDPMHHSRKAGGMGSSCGTEKHRHWMETIQNSAVDKDILTSPHPAISNKPTFSPHPSPSSTPPLNKIDLDPKFKYSVEANIAENRFKRSLDNPNSKKSCSLYIQTDPLFWAHIKEQEKDDQKTEEEILSLIAQHVKAVNNIYSNTPFDGKYKHNGYQFEVQRIKIHNDSQCNGGSRGEHIRRREFNQFCIPNIDVSNFLNMHSKSNHEEFCLAYVFTYRDFTGGTLGLAWVASASGASGGICETYKRYTENVNGVHHTAKRSLNTGIITFVNYNSRVPPKVSQLTLAHEIGHNFGSPHDYPDSCRPGGADGNFIMFASATSGDLYNNNKFSNCSKSNISEVLDAITDGHKPNCFTESDGAFCGNKIVEEGEECDCGFDEHECAETCCFPRKSSEMSEEENKRNRCTRKPGVECSPSEGPCCSHECRFTPEWQKIQCKSDDDCTKAAVCDGSQAKCPKPDFKPDNVTECNEGTQVCQAGECKDTICLKYGLMSCFLTSDIVKDKRQLCELACLLPTGPKGQNSTCMSTTDLVKSGHMPDLEKGLSLRPGSPCDNFQGYCDVFFKCRKVDAEGPLARLKNILFNEETLLTIAQWVTEFWWAVLLMAIGFVIFMALFIRCFAIHTPSSNPQMPKNLHFTETLRRPVRSLQQKGVYVGSWVIHGNNVPKHYRPANHGAPPPYPGRSNAPSGGPGHGYGEGRGHYNRAKTHQEPTGGGRSRGGSRSNRASRIEMQPMR